MTPKQALRILTTEARKGTYPLRPLANMVGFDNPMNLSARKRLADLHQAIETIQTLIDTGKTPVHDKHQKHDPAQ